MKKFINKWYFRLRYSLGLTVTQEDRLCADIEKMSEYITNNYSAGNRVVLLQCLKAAVQEELSRQAEVNKAKYLNNVAAAEKLKP